MERCKKSNYVKILLNNNSLVSLIIEKLNKILEISLGLNEGILGKGLYTEYLTYMFFK